MKTYKDILRSILELGSWKPNRTGVDSCALPYPAVFRHNMQTGFPVLTARQAPFKSAAAELCGFLRGYTSAADFRALGCKYWDDNANKEGVPGSPNLWLTNPFRQGEDDLGPVYGAQWRNWHASKEIGSHYRNADMIIKKLLSEGWRECGSQPYHHNGENGTLRSFVKQIDQLGDCVRTIINNPDSRRILFHAWNPATLNEIALPACHLLYQFLPNSVTKELGLALTIRSNDYPLGAPSNIIEAGLLLELVAHLTGYQASWLTVVSNDAHIYRNQLAFVEEYLALPEHSLPTLEISDLVPAKLELAEQAVEWLSAVEPTHFKLINYVHGPLLKSPGMVV